MTSKEENDLIKKNERLIIFFTKKYGYRLVRKIGWQDALQHGYIGALKGIRSFDETGNYSFSNWVGLKMRSEFSYQVKFLESAYKTPPRPPVSLSTPIGEDGEAELIDFIPAESPRISREEAMDETQLFTLVFASRLDRKDILILYLRFMDFTLQETGLLIGLSRERIRQRIANASRRLRGRPEIRKML